MASPVSALAGLLHEAGISWAYSDEIDAAIDRAFGDNFGSDDVAAALFRWRTKACSRALVEARTRARKVLKGDGTNNNVEDLVTLTDDDVDVEGQLGLFNTVDERQRLMTAMNAQKHGK